MPRDPRLFLLRHGETEWSKTGQHTSFTDLGLTAHGTSLVQHTASTLIGGQDHTINASKIRKVYVSPRLRAQQTLKLLNLPADIEVETTDLLTEMNYGEYEGLKTKEIYAKDAAGDGFGTWTTGYKHVGGESAEDVSARIDKLIKKIRDEVHVKHWGEEKSDVLCVAHGHVLRGFGARWLELDVQFARGFQLDAGGVSVLGYEHHRVEEPAVVRW